MRAPQNKRLQDVNLLGGGARTLAMIACATTLFVGCNRNKQEAILRANEAENLRKGDKAAAIEKLDEATRLDPDNHHIWFKLATVYEEKEAWKEMADTLTQAINADERNKDDGSWANYHAKRGYALEKLAQSKKEPKARKDAYEEAKPPYTKCIEVDENYADCYHQLGNVYLWTDDEQKALQFYSDAIVHNPDELRYYPPLADLYLSLFQFDAAEKVLTEAKTRGKPDSKEMWGVRVLMANVLQEKKDFAGAATELEQASSINLGDEADQNIYILYSLGVIYAKLEKKDQARIKLKAFKERCIGNIAAQYPDECDTATAVLASYGG